jgi:LytS/YehU family sensor histidine kinase
LEQLRFNNHFTYSISCSEDIYLEEVMIPPLLLQPFVENAIWHGLMHKKERGHLEIELAREDVVLCCTITDNGVGRRKAADLKENLPIHQSRGMQITTNRLRLLTDDQSHQATLTIIDLIDQEGNESGTKVKITIPT